MRDAALNSLRNHFFQKHIIKDKSHKIVLIALLSEPSFLTKLRFKIYGLL